MKISVIKNFINKIFLAILFLVLFPFQEGWSEGAGTTVTEVRNGGGKEGRVLANYAQAVPNDSYTFIGVSHPSLSTSLSQIGVALEVRGMTTVPDNAAGRAAIFTVSAGETHRIFVVNLSHSTINSSNSAFSDSNTHLILTEDSAQFGSINAMSINTAPSIATSVGGVNKYDNLSHLSMWGVVFIPSSSTGFALEFIGDAHDSTIGRTVHDTALGHIKGYSTGAGRGIN